jgi:hypothetical protein
MVSSHKEQPALNTSTFFDFAISFSLTLILKNETLLQPIPPEEQGEAAQNISFGVLKPLECTPD